MTRGGETGGADEAARHIPFLRRIAEAVKRQYAPPLDTDELVSCGFIGLREAQARFDPASGVRFETYAYYRVRGAMLEGIARQCPLSRHVARKIFAARKANDYVEAAGADAAGRSDKGAGAGATLIAGIFRDLAVVHDMVSVRFLRRDEDEGGTVAEFVDDKSWQEHERGVESAQLRGMVGRLPDFERRLLTLYYFENVTLEDAAGRLGVTKGWASKVHHAAIRRLRAMIEEQGGSGRDGPER